MIKFCKCVKLKKADFAQHKQNQRQKEVRNLFLQKKNNSLQNYDFEEGSKFLYMTQAVKISTIVKIFLTLQREF